MSAAVKDALFLLALVLLALLSIGAALGLAYLAGD